MNWQNHPMIRLVIPLALGMVGANLILPHTNTTLPFLLCCTTLALLFFLIPKQEDTHRDGKFGVVAMALAFGVGMTLYTGKFRSIERGIPTDTTSCQGILTEPPIEKARSWALNLKQENGTHILLYIGKSRHDPTFSSLQPGDTVLARLTHFTPTSTCPDDTFKTYYAYLFRQGICATAYAPSHQWTVHPRKGTPSLLHRIQSLQPQLHRIYDDHGIRGDAGSIIEAMTIGWRADLSPSTRRAYATSGVSHILALSGFHVGIIAILLHTLLFHRFIPLRHRWLTHLLTLLALWAFVAVAGFSPSLIRATLMGSILLLCQLFHHELLSIHSCTLALLLMLCLQPLLLHDAGFQLSFVSVFSICLFVPRLQALSPFRNRVLRLPLDLLAISLTCTLATAPLVACHFGELPLLALLSNLLVTPFVYLIMYGSLLWWLFLWCDPINALLTALLNWAADTMNTLTATISSLPYSSVEWHPSALTTLLCYILLLIFAHFIPHHQKPHTV